MDTQYKDLIAIARKYFKGARGSHGWDHVVRVCGLCEGIGKKEGADMSILMPAAILHDIGRQAQDEANGKLCHAELGAKLARRILNQSKIRERLALSKAEGRIEGVVECIRTHRFRDKKAPVSIEAKVLFDADKIDSLGAVGVGRAFLFAGEVGARLVNSDKLKDTRSYSREDTAYREYMVKLRKLPARIRTKTGKAIARHRAKVMRQFFKEFMQETR